MLEIDEQLITRLSIMWRMNWLYGAPKHGLTRHCVIGGIYLFYRFSWCLIFKCGLNNVICYLSLFSTDLSPILFSVKMSQESPSYNLNLVVNTYILAEIFLNLNYYYSIILVNDIFYICLKTHNFQYCQITPFWRWCRC